jgi:surface polysaccharide O-acyltransferase-like enzyme
MSSAVLEAIEVRREKAPPARTRLVWFDAARLMAAYSIVWIHTPRSAELAPWTVLGRFAVPFFTAAAVFFVIDGLHRQPQRGFAKYAIGRFQRIYVPFLAWCAIYLAFKAAKSRLLPDQPNDFPGISALWRGTFLHLWFMPFILVTSLVTFIAARAIIRRPNWQWFTCCLALLGGLELALIAPPQWIAKDPGFGLLIWQTLPAVCWGWALAIVYPLGPDEIVKRPTVSVLSTLGFVGLTAWLGTFGRDTLIENLSGMLLLIAALQPMAPTSIGRWSKLGSLAYGIYLGHLLFIKVFESLAMKAHMPICWQLDAAVFVGAAVGSTWLAWALARHRFTRWLAA